MVAISVIEVIDADLKKQMWHFGTVVHSCELRLISAVLPSSRTCCSGKVGANQLCCLPLKYKLNSSFICSRILSLSNTF